MQEATAQGLNDNRLVLIACTLAADGGSSSAAKRLLGTGYFVTDHLILSASHVVPDDATSRLSVRVEAGEPRWRGDARVVWRDNSLDAVLIHVDKGLDGAIPDVLWADGLPQGDVQWASSAYPDAAALDAKDGSETRTSVGLRGNLYAKGGGGQGPRELDLGVDHAARAEAWAGISGAPVFVGGELVGIIKSVPIGFAGGRLNGVPAALLWQNPDFRLALAPKWLEYPTKGSWVLVLGLDSVKDLASTVRSSVDRHDDLVKTALGQSLTDSVVALRIADALESPERWLRFVEVLCAAPIMLADVTGFEPGIMIALGVRAVVRRGLTITSTANALNEGELSKLPFNIQESKLISHGDNEPGITDEHPRFSLNIIARTIVDGFTELHSNPRYLDLPAYDAVRCQTPELPSAHQKVRETVLVLCSFHENYAEHWRDLSKLLAKRYPVKRVVRMVDIASPRLVGQALYENIRWSKTCVVDWTHWRANVFFELGVRLACSKLEPVCLVSDEGPTEGQRAALRHLFNPHLYDRATLGETLPAALKLHEEQQLDTAAPRPGGQVPLNATHQVALRAFDHTQERATLGPHELLRASIEASVGSDPQKLGETPVLFAANPGLAPQLWRSVREQWIASWLYLRHRYSDAELKDNLQLRADLKRVGDALLQWVPVDHPDASIRALREQVFLEVAQFATSPKPEPLARIRELKTEAKNSRDAGKYPEARGTLGDAIFVAQSALGGARVAEWRKTLASELADCYGMLGGVERRWALELKPGSSERQEHLRDAIRAYDSGYWYESGEEFQLNNTYNALNRLLVRLLLDRTLLDPEKVAKASDGLTFRVPEQLQTVASKIGAQKRDDYWSLADLALIDLLLKRQDAAAAYSAFEEKKPPDFAYKSVLDGLSPLAAAALPMALELEAAERRLRATLDKLQSA